MYTRTGVIEGRAVIAVDGKTMHDPHVSLATATKIAAVGNGLLATQDPNEQATILQKSAQEVGTLVQNARLNPQGADLFTRTNQVFGISAEFRFGFLSFLHTPVPRSSRTVGELC